MSASPWTNETTATVHSATTLLAQQQAEQRDEQDDGESSQQEGQGTQDDQDAEAPQIELPPPQVEFVEPEDDEEEPVAAQQNTADDAEEYVPFASDRDKNFVPALPRLGSAGQWADVPTDLWSDGTTVWVLSGGRRVHAFDWDTGTLLSTLNLQQLLGNSNVKGIWSDGETLWLADDYGLRSKVVAMDIDTGSLLPDEDFALPIDPWAYPPDPEALWSDGVLMWVLDQLTMRIHAYEVDSGERVSSRTITLAPQIAQKRVAQGIWSDGVTMWVANSSDGKVFAYNMPVSAALKSLSVSGAELGVFQTGTFAYAGTAAAGATSATVTAAAAFADDAAVTVAWEAADGTTGTGNSVTLSAGDNTITVTSSYDADGDADTDNADVRTYTVTVTVPPAADNS